MNCFSPHTVFFFVFSLFAWLSLSGLSHYSQYFILPFYYLCLCLQLYLWLKPNFLPPPQWKQNGKFQPVILFLCYHLQMFTNSHLKSRPQADSSVVALFRQVQYTQRPGNCDYVHVDSFQFVNCWCTLQKSEAWRLVWPWVVSPNQGFLGFQSNGRKIQDSFITKFFSQFLWSYHRGSTTSDCSCTFHIIRTGQRSVYYLDLYSMPINFHLPSL